MKTKALPIAILASCFFTGCTGTILAMPRDSGKTYSGTVSGGIFSGSIAINIDGETYSGPIINTDAGFGLIQKYSKGGAVAGEFGGERTVKGILSTPSGKGIRCEFTSNGLGGSGICVDDNEKIYDAIVSF
jgi:hypothetical protein